jgi:hypothetical protein
VTDNATNSPQSVALSGTGTDFAVTASPPSTSVTAGGVGTYTLTVTPAGGFNQATTLACSGLPALSTCNFSPSSVTPNGNPVTSSLNINTTATTTAGVDERLRPGAAGSGVTLATVGLACLVLVAGRRRHGLQLLRIGVVAAVLSLASGCGGGGKSKTTIPGTPAGTYTVTVTATSGSGNSVLSHNTTVTLMVN